MSDKDSPVPKTERAKIESLLRMNASRTAVERSITRNMLKVTPVCCQAIEDYFISRATECRVITLLISPSNADGGTDVATFLVKLTAGNYEETMPLPFPIDLAVSEDRQSILNYLSTHIHEMKQMLSETTDRNTRRTVH